MKKWVIALGIVLLATQTLAATCEISTGHGLLQDLDCDDVPDRQDNCPHTANPAQADRNMNGIGDACERRDTTEHSTDQDTRTTAERSPDLSVDAVQYQEFQANGPGAVYPVTITNNGATTEVTVYLENVTGTYSVNPSTQQTIPQGEQRTYYVHLTTRATGTFSPTLVIEANGEQQTVALTAHTFTEDTGAPWGWILVTAGLIIAILLGALYYWYDREPPISEEEDIYSYY